MNGLQTYQVFPATPEPLKFLERWAGNLWWCWHMDAIELFRRINPRLWSQSGRNPILFSTLIPQERLDDLAQDESYLAHLQRVQRKFESQVWDKTQEPLAREKEGLIAYFSMEFGIHEILPLFAGGLGVLADHHPDNLVHRFQDRVLHQQRREGVVPIAQEQHRVRRPGAGAPESGGCLPGGGAARRARRARTRWRRTRRRPGRD